MVKAMLCTTLCRRTLSWEPWRWERTCVFLQRCGSPAPSLRARRRPEWTTSLKSWVWPRWPTPRCICTHASWPRLLLCAAAWKSIFQGKMEMNAIYNRQNVQKCTFCKSRIPEWNKGWLEWMFCFRWALRWPEGSLEERGSGRASAWSWLLTPRCSFWMNQPRGWTPAPPTLSFYC